MKSYWLILFVFLLSCEQESSSHTLFESEAPGTIVLIFDNPPDNGTYQAVENGPYTTVKSDLSFIQDDFTEKRVELNHEAERDTLIIQTTRSQVEISHFYRACARIPFLLTKGDTILFRYEDNFPVAKILSRKQEGALNLAGEVRQKMFQNLFSSEDKINCLPLFINTDIPDFTFESQIPIQENQLLEQLGLELEIEKDLLDSAYSKGSISESHYDFFTTNLEARAKLRTLRLMEEGTPSNMLDYGGFEHPMYFASYRKILQEYVRRRILPTIPKINQKNGVLFDERKVFDQLAELPFLPDVDRDWLLFGSLRQIILNFSIEDAKKYIAKFDSTSKGYFSSAPLIAEFHLDQEVSNRLTLLSKTGIETELSEFLAANEGKVIYIDFWASWCRPCVEAFPDAEELRTQFDGKDVVFLYFSIDDKPEAWKNALLRYELGENSFLIQNRYTSTLLQDLNLETIPRYLLYNKSGQLIHRNAPGPSGEVIRELLNELLSE